MRNTLVAIACMALLTVGVAAKIKVKAEPDPNYDFATVKTWAWDSEGGAVLMARTQHDDPEPIRAFVDPRIRKYVEQELAKKGKTVAATGTPDLQFHYYVLVTIQSNGQYMGQFLPAVPYWGLPPFDAGTTSLEVATKGSLVLDAMLPGAAGERHVVWRGIAESTVEDTDKPDVRDARLRDAIEGLIKKFPLKKKNK